MKEHQLYELLIRIYRSPDVLLQLTGRVQKYAEPREEDRAEYQRLIADPAARRDRVARRDE